MNKILKTIGLATTVSALLGSSAVFADMNSATSAQGAPEKPKTYRFNVMGEALWWQANLPDMEYGYTDTLAGSLRINGDYLHPEFEFDPGFRVGVGYEIGHDNWSFDLLWTRFHTHGNDTADVPAGGWVTATDSIFATTFGSADDHMKVHLDVLDFNIGRDFKASKWVNVHPFFGLRSQWIDLENTVHYGNNKTGGTYTKATSVYKNENWGMGPRVGINTAWSFAKDWNLLADAAVSLLYGYVDLNTTANDDLSGTVISIKASESYRVTRADTDLRLGLMWSHDFTDKCMLSLQVSWEHHMFFDQWKYGQTFLPSSDGALSTSGVNVGGSLRF